MFQSLQASNPLEHMPDVPAPELQLAVSNIILPVCKRGDWCFTVLYLNCLYWFASILNNNTEFGDDSHLFTLGFTKCKNIGIYQLGKTGLKSLHVF